MKVVCVRLGQSRSWRHNKLHEEVIQMSMVSPSCYTTFSFPACTHGLIGSSLQSVNKGREDSSMLYRWFYTVCRHHMKVDNCGTTAAFWNISEELCWSEILPSGRTLESAIHCSLCLEGEMAIRAIIYQFMSCDQSLADGQGLRRNMTRKLVTRKFEEEISNNLCE